MATDSITAAATPPLLRRVNAAKLLGVLSRAGVMTGTGLIEATGLTRATVHAVCNDLIEMGWVVELDPGHATVGRPSRRFEFNSRAGYVLGVDVGAARSTVLLADLRGVTVAKAGRSLAAVKTPAERTELVDQAIEEALGAAGVTHAQVLAAGIGVAAPVDRAGHILADDEFWRLFDPALGTHLTTLHHWPALLENDANLATLGEHWRGVAQNVDDLAVLLAGERFGSGLMDSGRLLHGSRGGAGEMLYLKLVEGVGTTHGIARTIRAAAATALADPNLESTLRELAGPVSAEQVFAAAGVGDVVALGILRGVARRTARVIATLGILFNPELVVLGGGVAEAAGVLVPEIEAELSGFTTTPPRVAVSSLGDAIVSVGAVRHALNYVEAHALDLELRPGG
ncbi:ROK family transcriptional regulator [Kribbella sandramycini]|uniref:Putative NBD/HSP70 family sugar kinase n=1 Tax=Kribbella sandramycini TaxID=60450 RepID=A0A7Y4KW75_9ACTN|nr:ROK family transcriptional regulator [Kribbella sandramycini]MBB6568275.1 putative NBD/HSP70 family sugar kinase [Kribbella sandramycini]NOL39132.1 ROK family transcriptional regulator [Kribbella sandramycini]